MIKALQSMKIAFRALKVNKLRSILTMLGIIIGVGAVIAMVSIGSGASNRIQQQIASIGSNIVQVNGGSQNQQGARNGNGNSQSLTEQDATAIGTELTSVMYAAPMMGNRQQVINGNQNWPTQIQGTFPDYAAIRDIKIESGRMFTTDEVRSAAKVILLGKTVVDNLFPGEDPIGKTIRVRKVPVTVIGVLAPKGQSANGQDQDDTALMPISTLKRKIQGGRQNNIYQVGQIMVQARPGQTQRAMQEIEGLLRQRHSLLPNRSSAVASTKLVEL